MTAALLVLRKTHFVLWRVQFPVPAPALVIGSLVAGSPATFELFREVSLQPHAGFDDLWEIDGASLGLTPGSVYHYWFEINSSPGTRVSVTDPLAQVVDWQLSRGDYAAAVVQWDGQELLTRDIGGERAGAPDYTTLAGLPTNNQLVIYELPTTWTRSGRSEDRDICTGSFRDVQSLLDEAVEGSEALARAVNIPGKAYLKELGVNAVELLPPADTFLDRQWGYGTTNFFAADAELGDPPDYSWSTANRDFTRLVQACHAAGMRFIVDFVMAFSRQNPYLLCAPDDFFIDPDAEPTDPDARNSRDGSLRNGFGSTLFRYARMVQGYDPVSGTKTSFFPAREFMQLAAERWVKTFNVDGFRLDSIENISNWDFVKTFKDTARALSLERYAAANATAAAEARFLVVGEELSEPPGLLATQRLDGLWHEAFKHYLRAALLGSVAGGESDFASTIRKAIDCRNFGYADGAQAVIYLTSHDVEGEGNVRLYNFLVNNGVTDTKSRIMLAFSCLLTAVGIPMILAGEEFADQHDLFNSAGQVSQDGGKQVDPVNFSRAGEDEWRKEILLHVSRLTALRTSNPALAVNDTEFIHFDFNDGKRVMAWNRGAPDSADRVIVVANFSDYGTPAPDDPAAEYRINRWPQIAAGKQWKEITQDRIVPAAWAGREPIFPWEAKVYAAV